MQKTRTPLDRRRVSTLRISLSHTSWLWKGIVVIASPESVRAMIMTQASTISLSYSTHETQGRPVGAAKGCKKIGHLAVIPCFGCVNHRA